MVFLVHGIRSIENTSEKLYSLGKGKGPGKILESELVNTMIKMMKIQLKLELEKTQKLIDLW